MIAEVSKSNHASFYLSGCLNLPVLMTNSPYTSTKSISQLFVYKLVVSCSFSLMFLDLFLVTKLNIVRLYPLFPANFYFSYGMIFAYALLALLMLTSAKKLSVRSVVYVAFIVYSISVGLFYENINLVSDIRYWGLGLVCSYLFTVPGVIGAIINVRSYVLDIILATEALVAILLYVFPSLLGFPGYGLGVPAYLFAFYLARSKYIFAAIAFVLTALQEKRGFVAAVVILFLIFLYCKFRKYFLWSVSIGIAWVLIFGVDIKDFQPVLKVFRFDIDLAGDIGVLVRSASPGRFNEFEWTLKLFDEAKWFTGLGVGFEFERIAFNGEFRGMTGYTHVTPYNFYLVGGVFGLSLFLTWSTKSFLKSISFSRNYKRFEPLYISVIAFVSCWFSFWSAVSPWFWLFISFGVTSMNMCTYRERVSKNCY